MMPQHRADAARIAQSHSKISTPRPIASRSLLSEHESSFAAPSAAMDPRRPNDRIRMRSPARIRRHATRKANCAARANGRLRSALGFRQPENRHNGMLRFLHLEKEVMSLMISRETGFDAFSQRQFAVAARCFSLFCVVLLRCYFAVAIGKNRGFPQPRL